jgi:FtsZ-binding cell division protein ZapB
MNKAIDELDHKNHDLRQENEIYMTNAERTIADLKRENFDLKIQTRSVI